MSEIDLFEDRFADLVRQYAASGSPLLRPETLASAFEAGVRRHPRSVRQPWALLDRLPGFVAATVAVVLVAAIALVIWVNGGLIGPGITPGPMSTPSPMSTQSPTPSATTPGLTVSPTPSPTPLLSPLSGWGPDAIDLPWPGPLRIEPPGGAPDVSASDDSTPRLRFSDELGDVSAVSEVDISALHLGAWLGAEVNGASLRIPTARDLTEVPDPAELWIAYGVVVDDDLDGTPDFRIGMDNAPGDLHREWVTDLHTGETLVNPGPSYGFHGFGTLFDTYYLGSGAARTDNPLILFFDPGTDPEVRFYAWASVIADGAEPVTDFAPSVGWINFVPVDPALEP